MALISSEGMALLRRYGSVAIDMVLQEEMCHHEVSFEILNMFKSHSNMFKSQTTSYYLQVKMEEFSAPPA